MKHPLEGTTSLPNLPPGRSQFGRQTPSQTLFHWGITLGILLGFGALFCFMLACNSVPSSHVEYTPATVTITQTENLPSTTSYTYEFEGESTGLPLSISTVDLWDPSSPSPIDQGKGKHDQ